MTGPRPRYERGSVQLTPCQARCKLAPSQDAGLEAEEEGREQLRNTEVLVWKKLPLRILVGDLDLLEPLN